MENEKKVKESIFLGEHGVTSTSANYVANVAKEMIRSELNALDNLSFVTTTISDDINHVECGRISKRGDNEEALMQIPEKLDRVAKMKTLIGWLREGIKAKDEMIERATSMRDREVANLLHIQEPYVFYESQRKSKDVDEDDGLKLFILKDHPTEEEFLKQQPEAEQRKIQLLQSKVAVMGKFIHDKGTFGMARKQAFECGRTPVTVEKGGLAKPAMFYTSYLEVSMEKIDEVYFRLQNAYREVQQELNAILFKHTELWRKECLRIDEENKVIYQGYDIANREYLEAIRRWRQERVAKILDCKIIIPQELRELFDEVNRIGK